MKSFVRLAVRGLMATAMLSASMLVHAQAYPSRDITFIVPYGPGGSTDPISRQFSTQLEKILGANINVENKPGGSATIGVGTIVRARPDGYTIGLGSNSALAYQPLVNSGLAYKTSDDYQSLLKLVEVPALLVVRTDAPWKTFEEFMADVKKRPGKIRAANSGIGTMPDLVTKQLNKVAGVKIAPVPFSGGGGESMIALLGGRVEADVNYAASVIGHVQAGKVKVLAVFKKGKYDLFPDAASVVDAGYDATMPAAYSVIAPRGLPKDVQNKLVAASQQAVRNEEFVKFAKTNGYVIDTKGPEALKAEFVQYGKTFSELIKFMEQK